MYRIIVNWYENYCKVAPSSDFYEDLYVTMWMGCSKEVVEDSIWDQLSKLYYNHYGEFEEQTHIEHNTF